MNNDIDPNDSGSLDMNPDLTSNPAPEMGQPLSNPAPAIETQDLAGVDIQENDIFATAEADGPINRVKRGDEINITLKDPTIRNISIGVGWDLKAFDQNPLDLDAGMFLLDKNELTRVDEDFIFYNNLMGADGAAKHHGDNRTGAGDGDDETLSLELNTLPYEVTKISFVLSIYDEEYQNHNFSMVKNVFFRISNIETGHELFRYELDGELSNGHEGLIIGQLERIGMEWIFTAVGETVEGGLATIAKNYGIVVAEDAQA